MKLSDLFIDCYNKNGIHIVTILNTNIYYVIRNSGDVVDKDVIYKITKEQFDNIIEGKLNAETIYEDESRMD